MLLILAIEVNLMPNSTVITQLGIFLATVAVLTVLIFKPTLRIIEERKRFTNYKQSESQRLDSESVKLNETRTNEITNALAKVTAENMIVLDKAKKAADKLVESAQIEAKKILDAADGSIKTSEEKVGNDINEQAALLADEIINRVVRR